MVSTNDAEKSVPTIWVGESAWHGFLLALAGSILLLSVVMNCEGKTQVFFPGFDIPIPAMCTSKVLFGIDCPGCGLTRAFIAISHGQFAPAWHLNRASFLVFAFVAAQIPWHGLQLWRRVHRMPPLQFDIVYYVPVAIAIALIVNWIIKLIELSVS